jgi:hypothetical protein
MVTADSVSISDSESNYTLVGNPMVAYEDPTESFVYPGPNIKFCLFPLSHRPTKTAATQEISLTRMSFFHSY